MVHSKFKHPLKLYFPLTFKVFFLDKELQEWQNISFLTAM